MASTPGSWLVVSSKQNTQTDHRTVSTSQTMDELPTGNSQFSLLSTVAARTGSAHISTTCFCIDINFKLLQLQDQDRAAVISLTGSIESQSPSSSIIRDDV
ncbi:hypothetical protein IFR05_006875 [Cadophora sp. M221]|nr:hypothetical protein IFR05_006875 [Cadophora sp. M221]